MDRLPADLLFLIADLLPQASVMICALVCRKWRQAWMQPALFRRLAIARGCKPDSAPEGAREWRQMWWRSRRILIWPEKKTIDDEAVSAFLGAETKKSATTRGDWHSRYEIAFGNARGEDSTLTEQALIDALCPLAGNDYSQVPFTPEACCKGRTQGDFPVYLPHFRQSINLYRPQMSCDFVGFPDMFWSHGNVFCWFVTPETGLPPEWKTILERAYATQSDGSSHCLLEVRNDAQSSSATVQAAAMRDTCLFLSLCRPIAREDIIWALEMAAKWGVQQQFQRAGKDFAAAATPALKSPRSSEKCIAS